jgi:hypothetical protein
MPEVAADIIAYGLAAAASASLLLSAVLILAASGSASRVALFLLGLAAGLAGTCAVVFALGSFLPDGVGERSLLDVLKLALGRFLFGVAWHERPGRQELDEGPSDSKKAFLARLEGLTAREAVTTGVVLAAMPKRLVVSVLAASTIALAELDPGQQLALAAVYVLVATSSVWLILVAYLATGPRGESLVTSLKGWLLEHAHQLAFALSLGFGVLFTGQALIALLGR